MALNSIMMCDECCAPTILAFYGEQKAVGSRLTTCSLLHSGRQVHLHHHHHHYRHQQQGSTIDVLKLWAMKALLATVVLVGGLGYVLTAMRPPGFHGTTIHTSHQ